MKFPESFLYLPFVLQGLVIFVDEFYYHRQRGLGKWERIGHPIDTFFVFITYFFLTKASYSIENLSIYIGLASFSSFFVTKDEFVHAELCGPGEHWLHSILFILHPVCFFAAGFIWAQQFNSTFLFFQTWVIFSFMVFQILYWSFPWKKSWI